MHGQVDEGRQTAEANGDGLLARFGKWVESRAVQRFVTTLIILNGITLGLETSATVREVAGGLIRMFDHVVLTVFVIEILGKLGYRRLRFFTNGWNVFDFIIVAIALMPSAGPLAVLRTLRILRVMRLLSVVPSMRRVVSALLVAVPGMFAVGGIILMLFYVGSVLTTQLFGAAFPDWFGDVGRSMYTLFQVMTLESWSMGIVRPVMEQFPYAWIFFLPFIVATTFSVLNLFVGIIVDGMRAAHETEEQEQREEAGTEPVDAQLAALRSELAEVRRLLELQTAARGG